MDINEAIAEIRRVTRVAGDTGECDLWRGADFSEEQSTYDPSPVDDAIAAILNAVVDGRLSYDPLLTASLRMRERLKPDADGLVPVRRGE